MANYFVRLCYNIPISRRRECCYWTPCFTSQIKWLASVWHPHTVPVTHPQWFLYWGPYWEPNPPTPSTEENVLSKGCWRSRLGILLCDNIDVLQPWSQWPSITWTILWTIQVSLVKFTCRESHIIVSMCSSLMFHTLRINGEIVYCEETFDFALGRPRWILNSNIFNSSL